jgi:hypothetical protein
MCTPVANTAETRVNESRADRPLGAYRNGGWRERAPRPERQVLGVSVDPVPQWW